MMEENLALLTQEMTGYLSNQISEGRKKFHSIPLRHRATPLQLRPIS